MNVVFRKSLILYIFLLVCSVVYSQGINSEYSFGVDCGIGTPRGVQSFDPVRGIFGLPNDGMFGLLGTQYSVYFQYENIYASTRYSTNGSFISFDTPSMSNSDLSFLLGLAYPRFAHTNFWNITIGIGGGGNWGIGRGALLKSGLLSNTYEERTYFVPSLLLETKASLRFLNHFGVGLKYDSALNSGFSSNVATIFVETFL